MARLRIVLQIALASNPYQPVTSPSTPFAGDTGKQYRLAGKFYEV